MLCQVIRRRMERDEALEGVLVDYPRLTEEERETLFSALRG